MLKWCINGTISFIGTNSFIKLLIELQSICGNWINQLMVQVHLLTCKQLIPNVFNTYVKFLKIKKKIGDQHIPYITYKMVFKVNVILLYN